MSVAALITLMMLAHAQSPAPRGIEGLWRNPIGSAIIRVAPCGRTLCGAVVWASERGKREAQTSTPQVVGTTVLTDIKQVSGDRWSARLFIPDDNIHVSARLQLVGNRELKLTGCAVLGLFCRSQTWTRTDEPLPSSG